MSQKVLTPLDMSNNGIINLPAPSGSGDATNKAYVDALLMGVKWKDQVRAATTGNIALTGTQTVDGVALVVNDRVLVKNQSSASANGIYVVASGAWSRSLDADGTSEIGGMSVFVQEGTTQGNQQWTCSTDGAITLGTTSLTFIQIGAGTSYSNGTGINIAGSVINVDTAVVTRKVGVNIGDGSATSFNISHNLGTTDAIVLIRETASTKGAVYADVVFTDTNTVTVTFATAPTAGQYRVSVIG